MTTQDDIRTWLTDLPADITHVIIATDTFDYSDYPVYVGPGQRFEEPFDAVARLRNQDMTKVMEVYRLHDSRVPIEDRLNEHRAWHPEPPAAPPRTPDPRNNPDDAYQAFKSMPPEEFQGMLFSLLRGGVLTPAEQQGLDRLIDERKMA